VDEVTCDDEASVANKTKPDNQSVTVFVRLTGNTPQKGANNIAFARRTAIHLTGIMISPVGVKGQPFPALDNNPHAWLTLIVHVDL
jgi:hypothetical protein